MIPTPKKGIIDRLKDYHFNFKHITILFFILILFQMLLTLLNKASITEFLNSTQEWYQRDSAERLANLTTMSLELILESMNASTINDESQVNRVIQSFDIILNQQYLQNNINDLCIFVKRNDSVYIIDDGRVFYSFMFMQGYIPPLPEHSHEQGSRLYKNVLGELQQYEQISTITENEVFHTFVPFVLRGEVIGTLYIQNKPDFSVITNQIVSSFDETAIIYLSLILLGLVAMYFISTYTVKERDEAQKQLFDEHKTNLKKQINYEKELLFTKRIYHTHHKAEKIMGFIKEDLRQLAPENINEIKYRVSKYSNFISRVIYDMKWFDPPLQTIRNPIFRTNLNEVIRFIVENIFERITKRSHPFDIRLNLDDALPVVPVNEFVVWEIIEPLIQNSIEHGGDQDLIIEITTQYISESKQSKLIISDNGKGLEPSLLSFDSSGQKRIFLEHVSTKSTEMQNVGYGCYIASAICKRCGWDIDVINNKSAGCSFIITINKQ